MNENQLSLVDAPYNAHYQTEPVYTSAFDKVRRDRDSFIVKVRGSIYGAIRKIKRK